MLNRWVSLLFGQLALCLVLFSGAFAAEVAQGEVKSFDQEAKVMVIEEYDTNISFEVPYGKPTGIISTFDVSNARIGITPEEGDIVRIAYSIVGDRKDALKVMNVSKQDLRGK